MDNLIFISCGQRTEEERALGRLAREIVDATPGFEGYFAQFSQSLDGLTVNIFDAIQSCAGAIVFFQKRGKVTYDSVSHLHRSSVWVNQEVAILAYRRYFEGKQLPIIAFTEPELELEGAMTALIVNPNLIKSTDHVAGLITGWLATSDFPLNGADIHFQDKWAALKDSPDNFIQSATFLRVLIDEGGENVKSETIQRSMKEMYKINTESYFDSILSKLDRLQLIRRIQNLYTGEEISINITWLWDIRRALANDLLNQDDNLT